MAFLVHSSPKTHRNGNLHKIYRILQNIASQTTRCHQEEDWTTGRTQPLRRLLLPSKRLTTPLPWPTPLPPPGPFAGSNAEAMDAVIYDFAASIELDDEGVARGVDDGIDGVAARGDDAIGNGNVSAGNVGVGNVGVGGGGGEGYQEKER